jgi:hypothetical protein
MQFEGKNVEKKRNKITFRSPVNEVEWRSEMRWLFIDVD